MLQTAEQIISDTPRVKDLCQQTRWNIKRAINEARVEAINQVHSIIATMDWDVMSNTIDAKELQLKLTALMNEVK